MNWPFAVVSISLAGSIGALFSSTAAQAEWIFTTTDSSGGVLSPVPYNYPPPYSVSGNGCGAFCYSSLTNIAPHNERLTFNYILTENVLSDLAPAGFIGPNFPAWGYLEGLPTYFVSCPGAGAKNGFFSCSGSISFSIESGQTYGFIGASDDAGDYSVLEVTPTPEPAIWTMLLLGIGLTGATMRRRRASNVDRQYVINSSIRHA